MITGTNDLKKLTKHISCGNINVNLMEESIIQISGGIAINVDVSIKQNHFEKKIF